MTVFIAMLRGINVGGHNIIKMDALRALCCSLKFENPQTYVQSGNVIFRSHECDPETATRQIQHGIETKFGCRPEVMLRTVEEMRSVVARNPFSKRRDVEPAKLLVSFLRNEPRVDAAQEIKKQKFVPEEVHLSGRELYIYFPFGMGKTKMPWSRLEKIVGSAGTGRNWNSVTKMLGIAETLATCKK